jgi:preprotein translocase subunit SecB
MSESGDSPKAQEPLPAPVVSFSFERMWLSSLTFDHVKPPQMSGEDSPEDKSITLGISGTIAVFEGSAETTLRFRIEPNPKRRPYLIKIEVVGRFTSRTASREQLRDFCAESVPSIMYPHVRQIVWNLTLHGREGGLKLPLMNMKNVFEQTGWEEADQSATSPTEQQPPSEQSPSASKD